MNLNQFGTKKSNNHVALGIIALLTIVYLVAEYARAGDFGIFLDAGKRLNLEENIYVYNKLNNFKYYYSPAFALLLSAFSSWDYLMVGLIWKVLNLFFVFRIWKLIKNEFLDFSFFSKRQEILVEISIFLASITFITATFHMLQMSVFLLYAILEGTHMILKKKGVCWGALLLAVTINIKVMPIVVIPYLLYRKEYLSVGLIIAFFIALLVLPIAFLGYDYNLFLHSEWWASINPLNKEHIVDVNERGFHSLSAVISSLFTDDLGNEHNLQLKRNLMSLSDSTIEYILNFSRLVLVVFTLKVLKFPLFSKVKSTLHFFYEMSYVLLITPLIFPHQQVYGFLLVLPAFAYVLYNSFIEVMIKKRFTVRVGVVILSAILSNCLILFGFMREVLTHFKITTYGILLLLIAFILYPVSNCLESIKKLQKEK